jgi:hypothetical protein
MMPGKTHSRHFRAFLDEVNVSGDARNVGDFGFSVDEIDVTGWSDGVKYFQPGQPKISISNFQAVFNNTALLGTFTELKAREEYLVTIMMGIKAAPVLGDKCFSAPLEQKSMLIDGDGPILMSADFVGPGQNHTLPTNVWGVVLEPGSTSRVATLTGASVDNGASSANGAIGYIHITASDAGTWVLKIQDSTDDSVWADLITFSADGSAIASEQGSVSGTVDRYTRALLTRTSGAITIAVTLVRL